MATPHAGSDTNWAADSWKRYAPLPAGRRGSALALGILLLLDFAFFLPHLTGGRVLLPSDMVFGLAAFKAVAPAQFAGASNPLMSDVVLKFFPWQGLVREGLGNLRLPLWNDMIFAGTPLLANGESAVFYPTNLLLSFLPLDRAFGAAAILGVFTAGAGMFALCRRLGLQWEAALLAGIVFQFSGSMIVWLNYPIGHAFVWLPWLFYFVDLTLATRRPAAVAATAIVTTIILFAGHMQTAFMLLLAAGCFVLVRALVDSRTAGIRRTSVLLLVAGASVGIGVLMASVQLVPHADWIRQTNEIALRQAERSQSLFYPDFWKEILTASISSVIPGFFGRPSDGLVAGFAYSNFLEQTVYVGILPLLLALFAAFTTPWRRIKRGQADRLEVLGGLCALAALFFLCLAVRLPGIDLINQLPVFNVVASQRYRLLFTFFATIAAAVGLQRLTGVTGRQPHAGRLALAALLLSGASMLTIFAAGFALRYFDEQVLQVNRFRQVYPQMLETFSAANIRLYTPALLGIVCAAILISYSRWRLAARWFLAAVASLVTVDLFIFGQGLNPTMARDWVMPLPAAIETIQQSAAETGDGRVLALGDSLPPNLAMSYGLDDSLGFDFPPASYATLAQALGGQLLDGHNRLRFDRVVPRWLDLTGTRYVVAEHPVEGAANMGLTRVLDDGHALLYSYSRALPRATIIRRPLVIGEPEAALARVIAPDFDPRAQALVDAEPVSQVQGGPPAREDRVAFLQKSPEHGVLAVQLVAPALVVVSDAYYPGWLASVDGNPVRIYRANYAFRAVYLPAGRHEVHFEYKPWSVRAGVTITAVAGFLVAALLVVDPISARARRRNAAKANGV